MMPWYKDPWIWALLILAGPLALGMWIIAMYELIHAMGEIF